MIGRIAAVTERIAGSELAAAELANSLTLTPVSLNDFNWESGGTLVIGVDLLA